MILLIEDEEILRFSFTAFLTNAGYTVQSAATFTEGIQCIQQQLPSLIVSDIVLPDGNGLDILKNVHKKGGNCPVIMITGKPGMETATESVRHGAYDYLIKPVTKDTLLRAVKKGLELREAIEKNRRISDEKEGLHRDLETIFTSVQEGIVTVDRDMHILRVNQAMEHICCCLNQESIGKRFDGAGLTCSQSCLKDLQAILSSSQPISAHQIECQHPEKDDQIVMLTSAPLLDKNNVFSGAVLVVHDISRQKSLEEELKQRQQYGRLIGGSEAMQEVYSLLDNLSGSDATVLVTGESGTGKELVANALHFGSTRAKYPFIKVNCSSLSDTLLESELFGHVLGAFTGAIREKKGRFELADGGTLLLDEIGDISPSLQLKLLRVLQEREIERVGDSTPIAINVRIIAATNKDLHERIRQNKFRQDLYYRLKVVGVHVPPLRERAGDIALLLDHFCARFNLQTGKEIHGFSDEAKELLCHYPWPGNVRELEHAIEHGFVLSTGSIISLGHLPPEIRNFTPDTATPEKEGDSITLEIVLRALEKTAGNKARAARLLGISRRTIYRKLDKASKQ
jgi:two-component system response regulator HydG